jgi:hypothetical protein
VANDGLWRWVGNANQSANARKETRGYRRTRTTAQSGRFPLLCEQEDTRGHRTLRRPTGFNPKVVGSIPTGPTEIYNC